MDENERKRKRELGIDNDDDEPSDLDAPGKEKPREGLKAPVKKQKKEKTADNVETRPKASVPKDEEQLRQEREEREEKRQAKADAKALKRKEKQEQQTPKDNKPDVASSKPAKKTDQKKSAQPKDSVKPTVESDDPAPDIDDDDMNEIDINGLVDNVDATARSTATASPVPESPSSANPSTSSTSSIVPATESDKTKSEKSLKLPKVDHDLLKARLQTRLEELRAARKADGLDGKPPKNRQELLEARRRKQDQRKAHKKEVRKQARDDEQRAAAETELAQLRGSGSPLTASGMFSPALEQNFSFGRVKFDDGDQMDAGLNGLVHKHKKRGAPDAKTALEIAQRKQSRLSGLDEEKRADIEEKEAWLNAKKKAHGERVRDDTNLLKKTLKRKDKQKFRSEREWTDRIRGVEKGKEMKQKRRDENLRKRREEKGGKKGKGGKKVPSKKTKARPGFEGSFRSKAK